MTTYDTAEALLIDDVDYEDLTKQRAHLLAAIVQRDIDNDPLEGVLNLLDALSDFAEGHGLLDGDDRTRWWAEGCIEAGLGDPREGDT